MVISCLNAFTGQVQKAAHLIPARGQIIVTKALNQNPLSGIIHADKGYIYARNIGNRILIGGGRNLDMNTEETLKMETNSMITEFLLDFVNSKLLSNETTQIEDTWSCIMGMSSNKGALPIIEEVQPGYWACYRLGGMGVALSSLLARKLVHMI